MKGKIFIAFAAVAAIGSVALAWQGGKVLYINGAVASNDVRVINGRAYAPLSDIAKALGMTLQNRENGYELIRAGGAEQIANKNVGRLGTEIFTGEWRFTVSKVEKATSYAPVYATGKSPLTAADNEELVIVTCRIKNGTNQKDQLVFEKWEKNHTSLTDANEQAYEPALYDVKASEYFPVGASFLPGSAIHFVLVFRVPKGAEPQHLIFSAIRYGERSTPVPTDIRVLLKP